MILQLLFVLMDLLGWLYSKIVPGVFIPQAYLEPIDQIVSAGMKFDGLVPVQTALNLIKYIIIFEFSMLMAKMIIGIVNFFRGTGSIELD